MTRWRLPFCFALLVAGTAQAQNASAPGDSCAGGDISAGMQQANNNAIYLCTTTGATRNWYPEALYLGTSSTACDAAHAGLMRYKAGPGAGGGISLVQKTSLIASGLTLGDSFGSFASLPASGNTIVVVFLGGNTVHVPTYGVTDNHRNIYRQIIAADSDFQDSSRIFVASNIGTPTGTFTISVSPIFSGNTSHYFWAAMEFSGLAIASAVDQFGASVVVDTTSNTVSTSSATTQANELAVAAIALDGNGNAWTTNITHDASWTEQILKNAMDLNGPALSVVTKVLAATATPSHQWTYDSNPSGTYTTSALMLTLKGGNSTGLVEACNGSTWVKAASQ